MRRVAQQPAIADEPDEPEAGDTLRKTYFFDPVLEVSLKTSQGIIQLSAGNPSNPTYLDKIVAGRIDFRIGREGVKGANLPSSMRRKVHTIVI